MNTRSAPNQISFDAAGIPHLLKQKNAWVNWRAVEREKRFSYEKAPKHCCLGAFI